MPQRKDEKRKAAIQRQNDRKKRSKVQQLEALDFRLGKSTGAVKERARLQPA